VTVTIECISWLINVTNFYAFLFSTSHTTSLPPRSDHPNSSWRAAQIMKLLIMQLFQPPVTPSCLNPNVPLSAILSNNPSLLSFRTRINGSMQHGSQQSRLREAEMV
jgi:hypothetical protein